MFTAQPKVTWLGGGDFRQRRCVIRFFLVQRIAQQHVEFMHVESCQAEVKRK
jgi:hypothetical protein